MDSGWKWVRRAALAAVIGCSLVAWTGDALAMGRRGATLGLGRAMGKLQGYDVLVPQGDPAVLRAKVERKGFFGFDPDAHGVPVEFELDGRLLGSAVSGDDGIAALEVRGLPVGDFVVGLRLGKGSWVRAAPSSLTLSVRSREIPIVVTDIDQTISDASYGRVMIEQDPRRIPPMAGSIGVLREMVGAGRIQLLYLTARDDLFMNRTKAWLRYWKYPMAPAYFWDFGREATDHGRFKRDLLRRIGRDFPNLVMGVGDQIHDVEAYSSAGMRPYLIGHPDGAVPAETRLVSGWNEIRADLETDPLSVVQ